MQKEKKWEILSRLKASAIDTIITLLLENRGLKTKKEIETFLNPKLAHITIDTVGIDKKQLAKTLKRIQKAIETKEKIIVYGDYDVDGITGTAILWETLHSLGLNVLPYIPHRVDEGYGLSIKGIENLKVKCPDCTVIITVDNGIVAHEAVDFANKQGIDVIITDHHTPPAGGGEKVPEAYAIVHTTKLCGAGVAWMLSKEISNTTNFQFPISNEERIGHLKFETLPAGRQVRNLKFKDYLDLVALATVADLVPLTGANRALLKNGLEYLQNTKRLGLQALFQEAQIDPEKIGVYEIGHIIGPRINAMGRLESAMDSLRLLCTKNPERAKMLANKLGVTNRERQLLTQASALHAIESVKRSAFVKTSTDAKAMVDKSADKKALSVKNLLVVAHETYEVGIIGLIAGRLVEEYYRPSIVIAKGEKISKASARSVSGFNIIAFIRLASEHLINAGGHPMAAGFTIETEKIEILQEALEKLAEEQLNDGLLMRILKIDCEIPLEMITQELYDSIRQLAPFGMANPEPTFVSRGVIIEEVRTIGRERKHLKFLFTNDDRTILIEGVGFGMGERVNELKMGSHVDIVYVVEENEWNGRKKLQVKVKDIKISLDKK